MMRKPFTMAVFFVAPLLLLGLAGASQAQLALYDDFNGKAIDPARWYGSENHFGPGAPNAEATRKLANGQLSITLTTWGRTDSDGGPAANSHVNLQVTDPALVAIQGDVTVQSVRIVGCAANPTPTRSRAQIEGSFFNDGSSTGPGDRTGDIRAGIQKVRDSLLGDRIEAFIARCTDPACAIVAVPAGAVFGATWTKGVADTLRIQWVQAAKQFVFDLNPGRPGAETKILSYAFSDTDPPVLYFNRLGAGNSAANCMSGPRGSATMKALFDNVMIDR